MESIKVNLIPNGIPEACHASQYDEGRQIRLDLFDGFTPYVIQSGDTFTLNVRKPDNHVIIETVTGTEGNTYLVIETTEQMTAVMGKNLCEIRVENDGDNIGSLNFIMQVEKDVIANGIPSESVIEDLDALVAEAVGDDFYTKSEVNDLVGGLIDDESTANNKTWSSEKIDEALDSVQGEVEEIQNIFRLAIDESNFIDGKYVGTDGKAYNHADYEISPFIQCELSEIKFNCLTASNSIASIAFYSKANENNFISCYANTTSLSTYPTHEMNVPDGTAYIRVCKQKTSFYVGSVIPYVMSVERYETLTERLIGAEETADEAKAIAEAGSVDTVYRLVKKDVNLIPSDGIILHSYLNDSGEVKTSTNPESANYQMCISGYIPVDEGKTLYLSGDTFIYWRYFGWYDANEDYLGGKDTYSAMGYHNHVADVVVPAGAKYLRITCNTLADLESTWAGYTGTTPTGEVIFATDIEHLDYHYYPTNPCDFNGNDISVFKKIACIGDSITEGYFNKASGSGGQIIQDYAYPAMLEKLTGVTCANLGTSGATSVSWWSSHSGDDFSGYDCAIINFGINDVAQSVTETDFRNAFASIIGALKTANTGIKIFIASVNPAYARGTTTYDAINAIIEDIAENMADCFFIDLAEYGYTVGAGYVNGHLTACGYRRLAQDYKAYISDIVRNNPEAFRFIQFIGTALYPS